MNPIADLVNRTERLENHVQALRQELDGLRKDLESLQSGEKDPRKGSNEQSPDFLALALGMAEDLGPTFSAEEPDQLTGRGDNWFPEP